MSTSAEDMKANEHTFLRYREGDHEWNDLTRKIFVQDTSHKCPTYVHRTPPCQGSCPSGEDIRGWLQIVRGIETPPADMDKYQYAFLRSTAANPFPSMMGRVCPAPCQEGCNRNTVDDFVGINSVEQYIGDNAYEKAYAFEAPSDMSGKKVAIIGGGPAGMSAAYQLRKMGHASTIFDSQEELGGMMRYGIPGYRTPRNLLDHEIKRILDMGHIEVKNNTRVGQDVSIESLEAEYDAIIWAIGCWTGRGLPVDGWEGTPNCISGVAMLEVFNQGKLKYVPEKVVCVGGGDTSIDVVSVSRRLGTADDVASIQEIVAGTAKHEDGAANPRGPDVTLTSLFPQEEMTASEEEVEDALREGVDIKCGVMPLEVVLNDDGYAVALKMAECDMVEGRPVKKEGTEFEIECDVIVAAIGQTGDLSGLEALDNGRGLINADKHYAVPGKDKHFVAGDIVRPHLLTTAIGQGSVVSDTVNEFLNSVEYNKRPKIDVHHFNLMEKMHEAGLDPDEYNHQSNRGTSDDNYAVHNFDDRSSAEVISSDELFLGHFPEVDRKHRETDVPDSNAVLGHFEERMAGLAEDNVVEEAERCMSCGMCFECDNCVIYCPQDAVYRVPKAESTTGRYVATDYNKCIGCHICADVCPTGYIDMGMGDH